MVREYEKFNEQVLVTERRFGGEATKMTLQYDYALDHLKQIVRNKEGDTNLDYSSSHLAVDIVYALITIGIWAAAYYYIDPFKNVAEGFGNSD